MAIFIDGVSNTASAAFGNDSVCIDGGSEWDVAVVARGFWRSASPWPIGGGVGGSRPTGWHRLRDRKQTNDRGRKVRGEPCCSSKQEHVRGEVVLMVGTGSHNIL